MHGRITYTTTLESTPLMSPFAAADIFLLADVFADTVAAGGTQDIFLYWGYSTNDPYYKDQRNVSQAASGLVEIANFLSTTGFKFECSNVVQDRAAQTNEYEVLLALNNELMNGVVVTWWPDWDFSTAEYYSCIAAQRLAPRRMGKQLKWIFAFDFMVLPNVQVPSTVPPFVLA
jgi:hypothetical protein